MLLSIIIVNYKSTQYILDCLNSAGAELLQNDSFEWFVVDNDSKDDSENVICSKFPFVKYIQMGYNAGFARANNAALRQAKGAHVLLLNPDTLLPKNSITTSVERLAASSHIACGVQLVHADLSPQFSGSNFTIGGLNHLLELPYWGAAIKRLATFLKKSKPSLIHVEKETRIDWVSGAFLMVKRQAIDKAGLMDEDFFLYAEEVEWCSRLRKIGTICLYGDIQVIHLIGTSIQSATASSDNSYTNLSDKKGLQLMVSNHLRIRKQYGIFWFIILLLNYTWTIPFSLIASMVVQFIKGRSPFSEMNYLFGFANNVFKLWGLMPTIISGKRYFYKCI
jgi:GT2 family glycosyltransferase